MVNSRIHLHSCIILADTELPMFKTCIECTGFVLPNESIYLHVATKNAVILYMHYKIIEQIVKIEIVFLVWELFCYGC